MEQSNQEFSLRNYFFPFTTLKAVIWLVIIGLLVYFTMLFNGFVWDDLVFIINNPELHTVNVIVAFGKNFFNNSGYYRPLPELYFSLLYAFFSTHAFFYHGAQLALHILCTVLLFFSFKKFFANYLSFILSLLFLVHPINVESVSYIAASQSELLFIFGMCALLLAMYKGTSWKNALLISFLLLLSLLTKETGVVFLFVLFLYTFLFKRKKAYIVAGLLVGIGGLYALLRFGFGHVFFDKMGYAPISQLSLSERIVTIPAVIFYYTKTVFFPAKLAIDQQWVVTQLTVSSFYVPLFVDILLGTSIIGLGVYLYRKRLPSFKPYILFLCFFLVSFIMILQIFPLDMTVADRWFYVPFIGILGMLGVGLQQIKNASVKHTVYLLLSISILLFSLRTIVRNSDWYNLMTLYKHDAAIEDSFDNENNLGVVLAQDGDAKAALPHFLKANKTYPTEFSLRNTGMTYLSLNQNEAAREYLEDAMRAKSYVLPPHKHQTVTYDAYARYYLITKDYLNAQKMVQDGITDYPDAYTLWYLKAITEYLLGDREKALKAAEKAYTLYKSNETYSLYTALKNNLPLPVTISN